jgi:hypothetical protein
MGCLTVLGTGQISVGQTIVVCGLPGCAAAVFSGARPADDEKRSSAARKQRQELLLSPKRLSTRRYEWDEELEKTFAQLTAIEDGLLLALSYL